MLSLGANYQFTTTLYSMPQSIKNSTLNGNLYLKFSGDPSLTNADLKALLTNLQKQGIKEIKGNLILDDTIFPNDLYALGVPREDSMWSYGVASTSITLNENSIAVTFKTHTATPEIAKVDPAFVKVTSSLVFENADNTKLCSFQAETINAQNILLKGCIPERLLPNIGLAMPDPTAYAKYLIRQDLTELGITLNGQIITGATNKGATQILGQHASAALTDLLTWMLQNSDNLYASAITKTMGLKTYGLAGDKAGSVAIMHTLAPYQLPDYYLEDGDGASSYDLVTPNIMA
jgi:serine-type D-Ala-D-Ala carboxypeptidase/endopeptidase (penicillin-binding protein 4)